MTTRRSADPAGLLPAAPPASGAAPAAAAATSTTTSLAELPLTDVLAATALAERLLVLRTYGGRVLHLVPRPDPTDRRHRPGVRLALCGADIYDPPREHSSRPATLRPSCRRCLAVLRELTSAPGTDGIRWSASAGGTVLHAWTALSEALAQAHDNPARSDVTRDSSAGDASAPTISLRLPPVKAACSKVFTPDPGAALSMRAQDAQRSRPLPRCERCQTRLAARDGRLPPPTSEMLF